MGDTIENFRESQSHRQDIIKVNYQFEVEEVKIESLGEATIPSPFADRAVNEKNSEVFTTDNEHTLFDPKFLDDGFEQGDHDLQAGKRIAFEVSGPREKIFFDSSKSKAAIVTCGGLCPGLNDVVRALVLGLYRNYNVKKVFGVRYGYQGFIPKYMHEFIDLDPEVVDGWQDIGGTMLGSSRGQQDISEIVNCLERSGINILFIIGGDGTIKGAMRIAEEIKQRGLKISVIGVPKTIDNDIQIVDETFGFRSAVDSARNVLRCAHVEAKGAPDCIGLVKLMGRDSGFIACQAALAMSDVNFVLIPEQKFDLDTFLKCLHERMERSHHAVIAVAEGAGQELICSELDKKDKSGNVVYEDIGIFLKDKIKQYSKDHNLDYSVKYIDPSYIVRSVPANGFDSTYCLRLGYDAVHAAMAGKTNMIVGSIKGRICHIPMSLVTAGRKRVNIKGDLWRSVIQSTGQVVKFHV